jgi:hypothetical protein
MAFIFMKNYIQINKRLDDLESQLTSELDAVHTEKIKELEQEAKKQPVC